MIDNPDLEYALVLARNASAELEMLSDPVSEYWRRRALLAEQGMRLPPSFAEIQAERLAEAERRASEQRAEIEAWNARQQAEREAKIARKQAKAAAIEAFASEIGYGPIK